MCAFKSKHIQPLHFSIGPATSVKGASHYILVSRNKWCYMAVELVAVLQTFHLYHFSANPAKLKLIPMVINISGLQLMKINSPVWLSRELSSSLSKCLHLKAQMVIGQPLREASSLKGKSVVVKINSECHLRKGGNSSPTPPHPMLSDPLSLHLFLTSVENFALGIMQNKKKIHCVLVIQGRCFDCFGAKKNILKN